MYLCLQFKSDHQDCDVHLSSRVRTVNRQRLFALLVATELLLIIHFISDVVIAMSSETLPMHWFCIRSALAISDVLCCCCWALLSAEVSHLDTWNFLSLPLISCFELLAILLNSLRPNSIKNYTYVECAVYQSCCYWKNKLSYCLSLFVACGADTSAMWLIGLLLLLKCSWPPTGKQEQQSGNLFVFC